MKTINRRFLSRNLFNFQKKFYEQHSPFSRKNSKVYLDIDIDGKSEGRLEVELFSKYVPRTSINFYNFCKGFKSHTGENVSFKNSIFHKIIPGMLIQGGNVTKNNDVSFYGKPFADENYVYSHKEAGLLSMVNDGPFTNASQFFITTSDCSWFDGKHVVFGRVLNGIKILNAIEAKGSIDGTPRADIRISNCGVLESDEKDHYEDGHEMNFGHLNADH